jgi:hypothetical protein
MHGGFIFGLILIGPFALEAVTAAPVGARLFAARAGATFALAALAAALINDKLRSGDREAVEDALKRYDVAWTIFAPDNRIVAASIGSLAGGASMPTPPPSST